MKSRPNAIRITCDYRERSGRLFRVLRARDDIVLEVANLQAGDYIVEGRVTVERKTCTDFALSIQDGRMFRQAAGLKRNAERPVILIEGTPFAEVSSRLTPSIRAAITSLSVMWYLPVLWAADAVEAANVLVMIGRQWIRDRRETWMPPVQHPKRPADPRLSLLRSLPGVGPRIGRELLDHFGTISAISNATHRELETVPGIGRQRARIIRHLLSDELATPDRTSSGTGKPIR
ncbi:MAG: ERCC4 domain-containing protein [Alphaproteobacteria bacterium]